MVTFHRKFPVVFPPHADTLAATSVRGEGYFLVQDFVEFSVAELPHSLAFSSLYLRYAQRYAVPESGS